MHQNVGGEYLFVNQSVHTLCAHDEEIHSVPAPTRMVLLCVGMRPEPDAPATHSHPLPHSPPSHNTSEQEYKRRPLRSRPTTGVMGALASYALRSLLSTHLRPSPCSRVPKALAVPLIGSNNIVGHIIDLAMPLTESNNRSCCPCQRHDQTVAIRGTSGQRQLCQAPASVHTLHSRQQHTAPRSHTAANGNKCASCQPQ